MFRETGAVEEWDFLGEGGSRGVTTGVATTALRRFLLEKLKEGEAQ